MQDEDLSKGNRLKRNVEWTLVFVIASALMGTAMGTAFFAWKRRSDRAACTLNLRNVQNAVRAHANINNLNIGDPIDWKVIFGPGFLEKEPVCPAGGTYTFAKNIPQIGDRPCTCSKAVSEQHEFVELEIY
jgi:hypothetical protein